MNKKEAADKIRKFYFNTLIAKFPKNSHVIFRRDFSKHLFEELAILEASSMISMGRVRFLDVGAGAGINSIILQQLFNFDAHIIDRYEEFSEEYHRDIGSEKSIVALLEEFGVKVVKRDFTKDGFPFPSNHFDIISCFDVIEHFGFSHAPLLSNIESLLHIDGKLFMGTPNQVHFFNWIKALKGHELTEILRRQKHLKLESMRYTCYPLFDPVQNIYCHFLHILVKPACILAKPFLDLFQALNYYIMAISRQVA